MADDRRDYLRDLQERIHLIKEMQETPGWKMLVDYVAAMLQPRQRRILDGGYDSTEEYKAAAGWVQGAMFVLNAVPELERQIDRTKDAIAEAA